MTTIFLLLSPAVSLNVGEIMKGKTLKKETTPLLAAFLDLDLDPEFELDHHRTH